MLSLGVVNDLISGQHGQVLLLLLKTMAKLVFKVFKVKVNLDTTNINYLVYPGFIILIVHKFRFPNVTFQISKAVRWRIFYWEFLS